LRDHYETSQYAAVCIITVNITAAVQKSLINFVCVVCVCVCVSSTLCHARHILTPFQDTMLFSAQPSTGYSAAIRTILVSFCKRFWKVTKPSIRQQNGFIPLYGMSCSV